MAYKKCEQFKCSFISRPDDCPICPECNAQPCDVDASGNCTNCHCCEREDGYERNGLSRNAIKILQKVKNVIEAEIEKREEEIMVEEEMKNATN